MKINAQYVLQEPPYGNAAQPDTQDFILDVAGDRLLGEAYLPSGLYDAPHPAVVVCHGIPGTNNNDDLCQSLRRMGCTVIRLYHRGAWGSGGIYSFSHCIEDTEAVLSYLAAGGTERYAIDPARIFSSATPTGAIRSSMWQSVIQSCAASWPTVPLTTKGRKPFSEKKTLLPCSLRRPRSFISKVPKL